MNTKRLRLRHTGFFTGVSAAVGILLAVLLIGCSPYPHLDPETLAGIDAVVSEQIAQGNIPGAVVCIGQEKILYLKAFGSAILEPVVEPMQEDTIFDLASLTKPVATATCALILWDRGKLTLDISVAAYLPEFAANGKKDITVRQLMTHTSGLPAYTSAAPLAKAYGTPCPDKVVEKICSLEPLSEPGAEFRYSCLNYIILGRIIERISGQSLAEFAQQNLFESLNMTHTTFNPPADWQSRIAATEVRDGKALRGSVHDPLAELMAGNSGNAGVFSCAADLAILCRMLLAGGQWNQKQILSPDAVRLLTTEQALGRACGFDLSSSYSWIKGQYASPSAFCHSGYTGTSLVCDPENNLFVIILTNRVHPNDKGSSKPIRTKVVDLAFQAIR
ncbi:MAG: beta-lactamase family protein [Sedimentisphaerales bacterium]|nr:beta-lactamase family protein [Sedimentisphaerales bacterium]